MNIADWCDKVLDRLGDHEALIYEGRTWTSRSIHEQSTRFASALAALGVTRDDRVVVVLPNQPELVVAFPAILRAAGVAVLMHPGATAQEIERVASHAEAAAIITSAALVPRAPVGGSPRIRIVVGRAAGWESFDRLIAEHEPLVEAIPRSDEDLAQIAYTSGTTGTPKGVVYTHGALAARLRFLGAQQNRRDPNAPMVLLAVLPMGHAFGMIPLFYRFVLKTKLICLPEFDPRIVLEMIARHRVEFAPLVPSMCEALLASPELGRHDMSSLRGLAVGGAPVSVSLTDRMEAAFKIRPTVSYGMTELPGITFNTGAKPGSVGRLIPGVAARIVDDQGAELPPGQIGEILLKAPWMSGNYYRQSAEASTKLRDGWLHTGDLGYFDADRDLFIVGRSREIIIQAGNNVYPQEVVDVLSRMDGVNECAVVGVANEFLGEEVVACVVVAPGATVTSDAVIAYCRANLDPRKVPVRVMFVEALPKTELGKVRVHVLREQIERERARVRETEVVKRLRASSPAARREQLRDLVEVSLRQVLRDSSAAFEANVTFGDLGLDSLGAVELGNVIGLALGRPLPPTLTFSYPTVDAVTEYALEEVFGSAAVATARSRTAIGAREPIAVIGVGCRLPGGVTTPEQLWTLLEAGVDATRDIDRWNMDAIYDPIRGTPGKTYTRRAAMLDAPELFDAEFFGLTPREARDLDPQHRLLLETAWEAFEHAGRNPLAQRSEHAGVFLGISGSSYAGGGPLGTLPCMATGRVSYFLDLDGPCFAVDTACSSSLVAIHNAVTSLRLGECDLALAGGVNVMCSAEPFVGLSSIQALAPDGRCKAFDASADGFGRGEGSVVFVLRRLRDARADGDRVLGVIRGSAINHDGRSSSLTAPNGKAQEAVIRAALADAGLRADDLDYLEAHGTGTPLGDPIEIQAVAAVVGTDRESRLTVGSIKTNIGHLEAAAGAAGVLKLLLSFEHGAIPATLHQHRMNPMLEPYASSFAVTSSLQAWPRGARPRVAAVTSLGMSGTNAHAVIEEPPVMAGPAAPEIERAHLLCLSARSDAALAELAQRYADHVGTGGSTLADVCYTAAVGRAHFAFRLGVVASDRQALVQRLREHAAGDLPERAPARPPKIGFLFTGQGSQYVGMGRRLYETQRTFRQALQRCAEILDALLPRPLLELLFAEPRAGELTLDDTALAQPALFALEWALVELWRSWGIEPSCVSGHSLGEYVAACVAGVFDVEDGLRLVVERGRLMQALPRNGAMVALATDEATVRDAIGTLTDRVSISGINGPHAVVLSGEQHGVATVVTALAAKGVTARQLRVSHAFHSPLMDPILDQFERVAASVKLAAPQLAFISTVTGKCVSGSEVTSPSYWRRQIREPVRFSDAMVSIAAEDAAMIVEVGPSPILLAMGQQCLSADPRRAWLPSLRRDHDDWEQILGSLGELYTCGVQPRWDGVWREPTQRKVVLPTYPFQRQRFWVVPRMGQATTTRMGSGSSSTPERESARGALLRELAAAPLEERARQLVDHARAVLGRVLGRAPESIAADRSLLDDGLDSLRVIDFLAGLRKRLALEVSPAEFMARPSLAGFAAYLAGRLPGRIVPVETPVASPLITLNGSGAATPIFCLHPSGGEVTAYLRLRGLLGDDQPLYAIQSRATAAPEAEHATLGAMASDYADLVQGARAHGPYIIAGWSMGGVTAHAVTAELERRGERVTLVGTIDSPARAEVASELQQLALALAGVIYDVQVAAPPTPEVVDAKLRLLFTSRVERDRILAWCEDHELISPGAVSAERFDVMMRLRYHHFQLVGEHPRGVVHAPMFAWWAERSLGDWSPHTDGGLRESVVGGNHFTVIQSPYLETIANELAAAAKLE